MTVIGLTGPTGAGKTTALEALESWAFRRWTATGCMMSCCGPLRPCGRPSRRPSGTCFCRTAVWTAPGLARRVFADQRELERLNAIVYPAVSAAVEEKIRRCTQRGLVIDAINLLESGMGRLCDLTVALTAPPEVRLRRIMARDGISEERARARIAAQKPDPVLPGPLRVPAGEPGGEQGRM